MYLYFIFWLGVNERENGLGNKQGREGRKGVPFFTLAFPNPLLCAQEATIHAINCVVYREWEGKGERGEEGRRRRSKGKEGKEKKGREVLPASLRVKLLLRLAQSHSVRTALTTTRKRCAPSPSFSSSILFSLSPLSSLPQSFPSLLLLVHSPPSSLDYLSLFPFIFSYSLPVPHLSNF